MDRRIEDPKAAVRTTVRAALKAMSASRRTAASVQAAGLLAAQRRWQDASAILFYAPLAEELDVWPLLEAALASGKTVALPRFDAGSGRYVACRIESVVGDVQAGLFAIREPVARCAIMPLNRLDFILVPGVAFDLRGRRLGRGKGFYDQLLAAVRGTTCGVAFDEQLVEAVPVEPHDVVLNCILTPTRWLEV